MPTKLSLFSVSDILPSSYSKPGMPSADFIVSSECRSLTCPKSQITIHAIYEQKQPGQMNEKNLPRGGHRTKPPSRIRLNVEDFKRHLPSFSQASDRMKGEGCTKVFQS